MSDRRVRFSRPRRFRGEFRSPWELIRRECGWPPEPPGWALRDAGHDPRWYSFEHWPAPVVQARRLGRPMPEGFERYPGAEPERGPGAAPVPDGAGAAEVEVLERVDEGAYGEHATPELDARDVALPADLTTLGVAAERPVVMAPETYADLGGSSVRVDLSKSGGYVDRRSSRARDRSDLRDYAETGAPEGRSADEVRAALAWLDVHASEIERGL